MMATVLLPEAGRSSVAVPGRVAAVHRVSGTMVEPAPSPSWVPTATTSAHSRIPTHRQRPATLEDR
jgi:hypothetical protein